ncbi:hypothetical protein KBB89_02610 [Candidatus Gracilibacteria bacterium]|nr:hypothetical protein [Candidatus Gracilibacteria bacterium]
MDTKNIEQAVWAGMKKAGILKSIYNFTRVSVSTLVDGAYLGLPGEDLLIPFYDHANRKLDLGLYGVERRVKIAAVNPGIQILASRFLMPRITGDILAILEGKNFQPITHVEAENEGFLKEKGYSDIFTYTGDIDGRGLFNKMLKQERVLSENTLPKSTQEQILETFREIDSFQINAPELPERAYQVTKEGHGKLFLVNREKISI